MSMSISLPQSAPFAPEQIAALDQVIGAASVVQRAWLSGFLAGLDAGAVTPAAAVPAGPKPKLTLLYATESGNAEALAGRARQDAAKRGFAVRVLDMADADMATLAQAGTVIALVSTWGDGEPPQRAAPFFRALMAADAPRLDGLNFAVLALGDSAYAQFCETGRQMDARFEALGAVRVADRVELDLDYEAGAKAWLTTTLERLAPAGADAGSVIHVDFQKLAVAAPTKLAPFAAEVTAHGKLTSERAEGETYHVEVSLEGAGLRYEPGDALAVTPENDPALVGAVMKAAGLQASPELHKALSSRYDISTLTGKQVKSYAALTGDAGLASLVADEARLGAYLDGRQWIDLLEATAHRLEPEAFTGLLRPLAPRYYSIASSQKLVGEEAHLTVARLRLSGIVEYAALLGLAQRWIETLWDSLHPQLDPEDDNDPTLRGNALLQVANPAWVVRFLRDMPLARSPRVGSFSWRQIAMATGQI
ncbi:MAG: flavodoxin domain-containing protein, partial [Acidocella sp.]|nr:flavodoxin domain-containing protein [Acidocella sp.]